MIFIKKVELHVHLDGSVRIKTVSEILNISYDECYKNMVSVNDKSLSEYLNKFSYPIKAMQTYDNLKRISYELALDLIKDDIIYAEVRFAPIFHTSILSLEDVCKAVLEGFDLAKDKIKINLILCMMRNLSFEENKKIIDLYLNLIDKRIVGLDMAGDELGYPNHEFVDLFNIIKENNIPFTIHSGEGNNYKNVSEAINYGFKRIGHGIASINNDDLIKELIKKDCLLEISPTSNVDTKSVKKYSLSPIRKLFDKNVAVSINTDDRTVSNITLNKEYAKLRRYFKFSDDDFIKMNIYAVNHSFLSEEEKKELIKELNNR